MLWIAVAIQDQCICFPRVDSIPDQILWLARYADHVALASASASISVCAVPGSVKERPKSRIVQEDILATIDVRGESGTAFLIDSTTPGVVWIAEPCIGNPGRGHRLHGVEPLHVRRLGLEETSVDVLRVVEIVVVQPVVLEAGAHEPGAIGRLDEKAASGGDDLLRATVDVVVRGPAPDVFDVG